MEEIETVTWPRESDVPTSTDDVIAWKKKRGPGRPRIHPPKAQITRRSRGRPRKIPLPPAAMSEFKSQKQDMNGRLAYIRSSCFRSPQDRPRPRLLARSVHRRSEKACNIPAESFPTLAIRMVGSLQHVESLPVMIEPEQIDITGLSNYQSSSGLILKNKNEELQLRTLAQIRKIQRLEDMVEVKNAAIEHLKDVLQSLGVTVSECVEDALGASI